jgi:hypothetical protein
VTTTVDYIGCINSSVSLKCQIYTYTIAREMLAIGSVLVSAVVDTSRLVAAILTFSLLVSKYSLSDSAIEFLYPENTQKAVGTSLLSLVEAKIQVRPAWQSPSLNYFRFRYRAFPISALSSSQSSTPKIGG